MARQVPWCPSEHTHVRNCTYAWETWLALKCLYEYQGEIEVSNAQLSAIIMNEAEDITEYVRRASIEHDLARAGLMPAQQINAYSLVCACNGLPNTIIYRAIPWLLKPGPMTWCPCARVCCCPRASSSLDSSLPRCPCLSYQMPSCCHGEVGSVL